MASRKLNDSLAVLAIANAIMSTSPYSPGYTPEPRTTPKTPQKADPTKKAKRKRKSKKN